MENKTLNIKQKIEELGYQEQYPRDVIIIITKLIDDLEKSKASYNSLLDEYLLLKNDDSFKPQISSSENMNNKLENELQSIEALDIQNKLIETNQILNKQKDELFNELQEMKYKLHTKEKERLLMESTITKINSDIEILKIKNSKQEENELKFKAKVFNLINENSALIEELDKIKKLDKSPEYIQQIAVLEEDISNLKENINEYKMKENKLNTEISNLKDKNLKAERDLEILKKDLEITSFKLKDIIKENKELLENKENLNAEIYKLKKSLEDKSESNNKLKYEFEKKDNDLKTISVNLENIQNKNKENEKIIIINKYQLLEKNEKIKDLELKLEKSMEYTNHLTLQNSQNNNINFDRQKLLDENKKLSTIVSSMQSSNEKLLMKLSTIEKENQIANKRVLTLEKILKNI